MKKHLIILLVFAGISTLLVLIVLGLWLMYYQPTEVVIRTTFVDGRVETSGGYPPWRPPDFTAGGSPENPITLHRKDGTVDKVKKVEIWFRDNSSRDRFTEVLRRLQTMGSSN